MLCENSYVNNLEFCVIDDLQKEEKFTIVISWACREVTNDYGTEDQ